MSSISAGTTSTTTLVHSGDTTGSLVFKTNDTGSGGTTAMTIDTSQNVGIGTTTPAAKFEVSTGGGTKLRVTSTIDNNADIEFYTNSTKQGLIEYNSLGGLFYTIPSLPLLFGTANTERMRINSSGYVGFNTTSFTNSNGAPGYVYAYSGGSQNAVSTYTSSAVGYGTITEYRRTGRSSARVAQMSLGESNSGVGEVYVFSSAANADVSGGVYVSNGATSWSSASDERLKDIIEPISNGLTKVASLRSVIGKYKTDADGTRRSFLIAQDVQSVLPEAISSTKVQGDESEYLGVSYTDVIPLLVASIKELKAINDQQAETINALTARVVALESK